MRITFLILLILPWFSSLIVVGYLQLKKMTELLQRVIAQLEKLPEEEQDAIATPLLAELEDERAWKIRFESTTNEQWDKLDDRFDYGEERWFGIGFLGNGVAVVVWTERQGDVIRIISARKALSI